MQQFVYDHTAGNIRRLRLDLHDQRHTPIHHLKQLGQLRDAFLRLTESISLQLVVCMVHNFSLCAADSLQFEIMEDNRHAVLCHLHVQFHAQPCLHRLFESRHGIFRRIPRVVMEAPVSKIYLFKKRGIRSSYHARHNRQQI